MPRTKNIQSAIETMLERQPVKKIKDDIECWFQKFMEGEFKEIVTALSENFAEEGMS